MLVIDMKIIKDKRAADHGQKYRATPSRVILHHTGGKLSGDLVALTRKDSNYVSAHYLIAKNGDIYELVDVHYAAWHAGAAIKGWGNAETIGIEMSNLGNGRDPFTDEQYKAVAYLLNLHKIKKENVRDHKAICVPKGRKVDLAINWDWAKLWSITYGGQPSVKMPGPKLARITITARGDMSKFKETVELRVMGTTDLKRFSLKEESGLLVVLAQEKYVKAIEDAVARYKGGCKAEILK